MNGVSGCISRGSLFLVCLLSPNHGYGTNRQEIVYSRSVYGSYPWCEGITVSAGVNARMPDYADIAVDKEGNIYLVWQQWLSDKHQIMFTTSR